MTLRLPLILLLLMSFLTVSACSGSDSEPTGGGGGLIGQPQALDQLSDDDPEIRGGVPDSPELAAIAGLWNDSSPAANGEIDIFYLEITPEGVWNSFDYRGDNVNQEQNCYTLTTGQISSQGGNDYLISFAEGSLDFNAVVTDGRLVIIAEFGVFSLPPLVGISSTDFNLC